MAKKSEIKISVSLDENNLPEKILWTAEDAGFSGEKQSKSMMLSLWDAEEETTLSLDLWTKDMTIDDMNVHAHQVLLKLADTFQRATKNEEVAKMIEDFSAEVADKLDLIKRIEIDGKDPNAN